MIGDRWPLVDAATMRALDQHTIRELGVPGELLMESAGRAVAEAVLALWSHGESVRVICGAGNNGGDGLVAARHLHLLGVPVRVALLADPATLSRDAAANHRRAAEAGVPCAVGVERIADGDVVVDAIFGTGLSRPVSGAPAQAIERIVEAEGRARIVAVDLPSGLCADTGQVLGVAARADVTVTLGLPKLGLALEPGRSHAGRVVVARIGIADAAPERAPSVWMLSRMGAGRALPARPAAGHKGSFGHVLVVAGSEGKTGAAALAAAGAMRAGAGLVTVACPSSLHGILETKCTEAMTTPIPEESGACFGDASLAPVLELAAERDVTVLGPGLGRDPKTRGFVRELVERIETPLVVDADALFALAGGPGLRDRRAPTVLTPHPGEAARLLGLTAQRVNEDRPAAARELVARTGAVALLKGAASLVGTPEGALWVNPTGGPALGSAGTGDVLSGVVAALLAQGSEPELAAALGAFVHGDAADRIAARQGEAGLAAGDLALEVPPAMEALRAEARVRKEDVALALPFPEPR